MQQPIEPGQITVGEVVAQNYHAAGVFREYGMDFCCGGGITLQKACEEKSIDPEELVTRLKGIPWAENESGANYKAWQPDFLIDHIVSRHHRFVREKVVEISAYAAKVARVHGERHPENIEIYQLFQQLATDLMAHLEAEEERLFPLVKELLDARLSGKAPSEELLRTLKSELVSMVDDHEQAGAILARFRELSNDYTPPEDACTTYRILYQNLKAFEEDLHLHVHLENNILMPKTERLV